MGCFLFEREHHQRIAKALRCFDPEVLQRTGLFFGGGTAIVLALGEYRLSNDIDFLCASEEGYRFLRNAVNERDLGVLTKSPFKLLREVRTDRYGIRTAIEVDGVAIRLEFVSEGRIELQGELDEQLGVPVLSRTDMFAEKLLANADRGLDRAIMCRDLIDLAMMITHWGEIPPAALDKARKAYGKQIDTRLVQVSNMLSDPSVLSACLKSMAMDQELGVSIRSALHITPARLPGYPGDLSEDDTECSAQGKNASGLTPN